MRSKKHQPMDVRLSDPVRRREVEQEIDNFLRALSSYPEHFAHDPCVSFESHLFRVAAAGQSSSGSKVQEEAPASSKGRRHN